MKSFRSSKISRTLLSLVVLVALAALLFTCGKPAADPEKAEPAELTAVAVRLVPVEKVTVTQPIVSSGLISTDTESRLSFKVGGVIQRIYVKEGASVAAGQLLASLDLTEIDAQVSQAKNNFDKASRDLARVQRLYADSAATLEQRQNAQTGFDVAREAYTIATFNRQYATIHATASGKVIRKLVNEGEFISPGTPVLQVNTAGSKDWIVKVGLPDVDWVRVHVGDPVTVSTDAYSGVDLVGDVNAINEGADPFNGLYQVEVRIKAAGYKLASGLFARVTIHPVRQQTLWRLPIEAVIEGQGDRAFVFVPEAGGKKVKKQPIQIAFLQGDYVFVRTGLEAVPEVVNEGAAFLTEYAAVTIQR
jgi:multidrug efflux system membrane fusion protein